MTDSPTISAEEWASQLFDQWDIDRIKPAVADALRTLMREKGDLETEIDESWDAFGSALRKNRKTLSVPEQITALCIEYDQEIESRDTENARLTAEVARMREALEPFLKMRAAFDASNRNQADAYYAFVKGKDAAWEAARAALHPIEQEGEGNG